MPKAKYTFILSPTAHRSYLPILKMDLNFEFSAPTMKSLKPGLHFCVKFHRQYLQYIGKTEHKKKSDKFPFSEPLTESNLEAPPIGSYCQLCSYPMCSAECASEHRWVSSTPFQFPFRLTKKGH